MERFELSTDIQLDAILWSHYVSFRKASSTTTRSILSSKFNGAFDVYCYVTKIHPNEVMDALYAQYQRNPN